MNKIKIDAVIAADVKKVWEYYTSPMHIVNWNFATDDWKCPWAKNDMVVGGKYIARMEAKDGSFGFDFEAAYNEIIPYKKFTYTMTVNREVNVEFNDLENKTEVIVLFDAESENSLELQRDGWQSILNNFKKYTESN